MNTATIRLHPEQEADNILTELAERARKAPEKRATERYHNEWFHAVVNKNGRVGFAMGISGKRWAKQEAVDLLAKLIAEQTAFDEIEARRIPLKARVNYCDGPGGDTPHVSLVGTRLLRLGDSFDFFHVGAVPRGTEARKEHLGPMVPGPWAYAFGAAAILTDDVETRKRTARERAEAMVVREGSVLRIDGIDYRVKVDVRGPWLKLDMVAP